MYKTQRYQAEIPVKEYLERYVDVETFLESCRACPNYGKLWSCPPYEFDPLDYWREYNTLYLIAEKIQFDKEYAGKSFPQEKIEEITRTALGDVKARLSRELYEKEQEFPGSVSLSAGCCTWCGGICKRTEGQPCRFPDKMRYSIESLGGNVGLTISRLMGIELEWMKEGTMPRYFVLVSGLLVK